MIRKIVNFVYIIFCEVHICLHMFALRNVQNVNCFIWLNECKLIKLLSKLICIAIVFNFDEQRMDLKVAPP